ncbi:MAG: DMT family transporter [Verrucomicrobiota bacterium]|nr:DMT family transporter [Verrucomicrobiota bacterium]
MAERVSPSPLRVYLTLVLGIFACATSVIFIRKSTTDAILLSAARLLLAALFLLPVFWRDIKKHAGFTLKELLLRAAWPAVLLGIHFISWIMGARLTLAANASIIVNMVPAVSPLLLLLLTREIVNRREAAGTIIALIGVVLLAFEDYHLSRDFFRGDIICFLSMLFYASYLVMARRNRAMPSIWLYVVPLYAMAGFLCLVIYAAGLRMPSKTVFTNTPIVEWGIILGLTLVPTIIGHSIMNWSFKHLRGQTVSICNQGQFIFAGALGLGLLGDVPGTLFYVASVLLVGGAILSMARPAKG